MTRITNNTARALKKGDKILFKQGVCSQRFAKIQGFLNLEKMGSLVVTNVHTNKKGCFVHVKNVNLRFVITNFETAMGKYYLQND